MVDVSVGWIVNLIIFILMLVLTVLTLVGAVAGLVHAVATRPDAYPAIDTKSKGFWVAILAVCSAVAALFGVLRVLTLPIAYSGAVLTSFAGLFLLASMVGTSVYLVDIRPRIDEIQGRSWFRKAA
ncbi:hypothetical protein GCM10023217_12890 [Gordonia alkaliphila]|uniref:DUF2516 family protein n=1 Tax=Gordonia alkaliphila TaxID=1053547 RepID=A0ABP8Z369_9ACTN